MKFLKKKGYEGTLRKIADDDKTKVLGVVGTVGDLIAESVLEYCDAPLDSWGCVRTDYEAFFGETRDLVISAAGIR